VKTGRTPVLEGEEWRNRLPVRLAFLGLQNDARALRCTGGVCFRHDDLPSGFSPQNLLAARVPVKPHWLAETT
jgi:hypothetical protein